MKIVFFSKIHQMALGIVWNVSNEKNDTTPNNKNFFILNNFAFIPTKDIFTLKALKMHCVFLKRLRKRCKGLLQCFMLDF